MGCLDVRRNEYIAICGVMVTWLQAAVVFAQAERLQHMSIPDYYRAAVNQQQGRVAAAINNLTRCGEWEEGWGEGRGTAELGQVSAVSVDDSGRVLVFHRGARVWDGDTFDETHRYIGPAHPIPTHTVLELTPDGSLLRSWGDHMFYLPHGLTAGGGGDVWLTDVALHQVFKFAANNITHPVITLGTRLEPGQDERHLCKPSAVAVLDNGDVFVADGYCNSRILKFDATGRLILQFGRRPSPGESGVGAAYSLLVPHALTLAGKALCVADREHGRVACFDVDNGTFLSQYSNWLFGNQIFSVAFTPTQGAGGVLYVVTGEMVGGARGYALAADSGRLLGWFGAGQGWKGGLRAPHDVAVAPGGSALYVAELGRRLLKFTLLPLPVTPAIPPHTSAPLHKNASSGAGERAETGAGAAAIGAAGTGALLLLVWVMVGRYRGRARATGQCRSRTTSEI